MLAERKENTSLRATTKSMANTESAHPPARPRIVVLCKRPITDPAVEEVRGTTSTGPVAEIAKALVSSCIYKAIC